MNDFPINQEQRTTAGRQTYRYALACFGAGLVLLALSYFSGGDPYLISAILVLFTASALFRSSTLEVHEASMLQHLNNLIAEQQQNNKLEEKT